MDCVRKVLIFSKVNEQTYFYLRDFNGTQTHNHLVRKRALNYLAKIFM